MAERAKEDSQIIHEEKMTKRNVATILDAEAAEARREAVEEKR